MQNRDTLLLSIRPMVPTEPAIGIEQFQNETLRPVLKLQHDTLIALFQAAAGSQISQIAKKDIKAQTELIGATLRNDVKLRNEIIGLVIGHFTSNELSAYHEQKDAIRKRILSLAAQRIGSVLGK